MPEVYSPMPFIQVTALLCCSSQSLHIKQSAAAAAAAAAAVSAFLQRTGLNPDAWVIIEAADTAEGVQPQAIQVKLLLYQVCSCGMTQLLTVTI